MFISPEEALNLLSQMETPVGRVYTGSQPENQAKEELVHLTAREQKVV